MTYLHDKNFHFVNIKIKYIKENIEKATKKKRPINEKIKICNQQIVINSLQQPLFYETSFFISLNFENTDIYCNSIKLQLVLQSFFKALFLI